MERITADVLVLGGGSAATRAALEARKAGADVLLVDKGTVSQSGSSPHALVGFSVPLLDEADSQELFLQDWINASGGICDRSLVVQCARHGLRLARELDAMGVEFITNPDGSWFVSKRAGHSVRRTLQAKGRGRGVHSNVIEPLRDAIAEHGVRLQEQTMVTRLLKSGGRVAGAYAVTSEGKPLLLHAKAVVLAAGGANRLYSILCDEVKEHYSRTTGDSYALAFHAGAPLVDMEFTQFRDSPPAGPIYGARYLNALGERVMEKYDPANLECAPRYMMARAIYWENFEGRGPVVWHVEEGQVARSRAPIGEQYQAGQTVEITLMFQRLMGGAHIDEQARTRIPGLFAAGESSGGVLGGDRMQGCGFLETQTFGMIAGRIAAAEARSTALFPLDEDAIAQERDRLALRRGDRDPAAIIPVIQKLMWEQAGVVSNRQTLTDAIGKLQAIRREAEGNTDGSNLFAAEEASNLALTAEIVAQAKLTREETRSGHGRTDFPEADERWLKHVCITKQGGGLIGVGTVPIVMSAEAVHQTDELEMLG
jgi:fumarate reductase (CoM/CoB) subunit A